MRDSGMPHGDPDVTDLVERFKGRYYGKYRGVVSEVEDGGRGRIKAKVQAVLGTQTTGWCEPCVPYAGPGCGVLFLPETGSGVWIEFEAGDLSRPIWTGCYWRDGEDLPEDAGPKKKVIRTNGGHQILFDDDAGKVTIKDSNENEVTLDSSGILLKRGSYKVEITDSKVAVCDSALEVV